VPTSAHFRMSTVANNGFRPNSEIAAERTALCLNQLSSPPVGRVQQTLDPTNNSGDQRNMRHQAVSRAYCLRSRLISGRSAPRLSRLREQIPSGTKPVRA
jgi:hypothetical protein